MASLCTDRAPAEDALKRVAGARIVRRGGRGAPAGRGSSDAVRRKPAPADRLGATTAGGNGVCRWKRGLDSFVIGAEGRKMASIRPGGATNVPNLSFGAICATILWHAGDGSCSEFTRGSFGENASCLEFPRSNDLGRIDNLSSGSSRNQELFQLALSRHLQYH